MLHVWKDSALQDEIQNIQLLTLGMVVPGTNGTTYNLVTGTGIFVYQLYKFSAGTLAYVPSTDYTVTDDQLVLTTGLVTGEVVIVVPNHRIDQLFGGSTGDEVVVQAPLWLSRDTSYYYSMIRVYSQDVLTALAPVTQLNIQITNGVSNEGLSGQVPGALVGMAACFNGTYIGMVTSNTSTAIAIDNAQYSSGISGKLELLSVAHLKFALDVDGVPGTFYPVLNLPDMTTLLSQMFWMQDGRTIPEDATNYPNVVLRVQHLEYVATP